MQDLQPLRAVDLIGIGERTAAKPTLKRTANSTLKPRIKTSVNRNDFHAVISSSIPPMKPIDSGYHDDNARVQGG